MPDIAPEDDAIFALWDWFAGVAGRLRSNYEDDTLQAALQERVAAIGPLAWELGPGINAECCFTLSPDGAAAWLPVTMRAVAMAPEVAGWEFHPAKQRKAWDLQFSLCSERGHAVDIDARPWRYALLQFPEGPYDIIVEQGNCPDLDDGDRYTAAVIVLDSELGEARRLLAFDVIEPTVQLAPEYAERASSIKVLSEHLRALDGPGA